jgi:uncharacterized protein with von Willebrand factor type A (vWA) domain
VGALAPSSSAPKGRLEGRLADNIVFFARALRAAGIPVGPGAVIDALMAVQTAGIRSREEFFWTLRTIFVKRHEHFTIFEQAFRLFFRNRDELEALLSPLISGEDAGEDAETISRRVYEALFAGRNEKEDDKPDIEKDSRFTVSDAERLQRKDFAQMSAAEIAAAKDAIARLVLPVHEVKTRRLGPHPRGHRIDIRRTFRNSMKAGGAIIDLHYLGPKTKEPPLVALLDISGSMSQYTRLFLHFLHGLAERRKRVHSFLFGTRLTNITRMLEARDPDEALAQVSHSVEDWSGGTRIAASLHAFNKRWSRRVLTQGAVVLLITDGLERDADTSLTFEIDRLHRSCRRLIWLNPLLRFEGFEAKAQGVRAMLPHVDEFRPIHNLESMAGLVTALSQGSAKGHDPRAWLRRVA